MRFPAPGRAPDVQPDDNHLMALVQAGDHDAFARLYDRYADRAYRVARSVSTDDARAQHAVREGFASIWKARATYRPERPTAAAWVLTRVRHHAIELERREMTTGLVNRLPEPQAEVIALSCYGELTHTEIAAHLGLPVATVKGHMRLGLQKLRAQIDGRPA
jgi:RNA polymerase sigma-70 factor (ECF subfamily)